MIDVLPTLASMVGRGGWKEEAEAASASSAHRESGGGPGAGAASDAGHPSTASPSTGNPSPSSSTGRYSGRSLADVLSGRTEPVHDAVFSEGEFPNIHAGQRRSIRTERWLYTRYPEIDEEELFDLQTDPSQTANVAASNRDVVAELAARIDVWQRQHGARVPISFGA